MVYIASGWWKPGHLAAIQQLEHMLDQRRIAYFSPRSAGLVGPDSSKNERRNVFLKNLREIRHRQLVFARIDDYDPGTIWEMGYAYSEGKRIICWSLVEGRGLNLMLAEGADGFVNGWNQIMELFPLDGSINWEVATQWAKEIQ